MSRQEADQADLHHFSFSTGATATEFKLAPGPAEIRLHSIHYQKTSTDLEFFFSLVCTQEVFRGTAGASVLLAMVRFLKL